MEDRFSYLCRKIEEWKACGMLIPPAVLATQRFQVVAHHTLMPLCESLAQALTNGGLPTTVSGSPDDETRWVTVQMVDYDAVIAMTPSPNPSRMRITATGGHVGTQVLTWDVPYRSFHAGGMDQQIEAIVFRLVSPQRLR
ncbi:MAG: hypothetical protein OJF52_001171 [Nitrospira sp.]|jgi:hypothetical protein|nr:MAG: hypothetical protein OJF52_001171 [Nitrospira sp.]